MYLNIHVFSSLKYLVNSTWLQLLPTETDSRNPFGLPHILLTWFVIRPLPTLDIAGIEYTVESVSL